MNDIEKFKKQMHEDIQHLLHYIPIIIPKDEKDEHIFKIGMDMLKCLDKDLTSRTIPDSDYIKIAEVEKDWSEVYEELNTSTTSTVMREIENIIDEYSE